MPGNPMPTTKVIQPPKRSLAGVLAKFSPDFMADGRGENRQKARKTAQAHPMTLLPGKMKT